MVSDFLAIFALVWPLTVHAFVGYDAHGEVVDGDAVVLATHDLGGHVAGCAGRVLRVFRIPDAGNAQVGDAQVAIFVENQIFRLDVPV